MYNSSAAVETEFSLSARGLMMYYGDVEGGVHALQLGESLSPTAAPTEFPTYTSSPSELPSLLMPTESMIPSTSDPTLFPSELPTKSSLPSVMEVDREDPIGSPQPTLSSVGAESQQQQQSGTVSRSSSARWIQLLVVLVTSMLLALK